MFRWEVEEELANRVRETLLEEQSRPADAIRVVLAEPVAGQRDTHELQGFELRDNSKTIEWTRENGRI